MLTLRLTILLISLVSGCSGEIKLADEYLDVQFRPDGPAEVFASVLDQLDLKSAKSQADIPEVMKKLQAATNDDNTRTILKNLVDLADNGEECPKGQAQVFVRLIKVIDDSKKGLENVDLLRSHLIETGKRRFNACSSNEAVKLKKTLHRSDVVPFMENIDAQFKRALSKSGRKTSEKEMYEKLKDYHPATDETNVDWLWFYSSVFPGGNSSESIKNMFEKTCMKFWLTFRPALDTLNVARILNPGTDYFMGDIELLALNERNRVCNEMHNNPEAFLKQLKTKQLWYHKTASILSPKISS